MLSWQLWNTFQRPPRDNPVFRWTQTQNLRVQTHNRRTLILTGLLLFAGWAIIGLTAPLLPMIVMLDLLGLLIRMPVLVLVVGVMIALLYCTSLSGAISNGIHRVRELQIYDILCLTPPGIFGVTWTIAAGISHRRRGAFWFGLFVQAMVGSLIIGMTLTLGVTFVVMVLSHTQEQAVVLELVNVVMVCLALYIGCVQAFSNSVLTGMLTPLVLSESMPLYIITIGLYLMMETYIILLAGLVGVLALPALLQAVNISGFGAELLLPVLRVVVFCGLHEISNRAVWRVLRKRLNAAELMPML